MSERAAWNTADEKAAVEAVPMADRWTTETVHQMLTETARAHPSRPALSFQIKSGPKDKAETLDWTQFATQVTQAANMFRRLGAGPEDGIAFLLPNCNETVVTLIGAMTAGIACPINPLLEVEQIASILRETKAKILVTLSPFPKTDLAEKAHAAAVFCPELETILEIDLKRYLSPPISWIVPFLRPKIDIRHDKKVLSFASTLGGHSGSKLDFAETGGDRIAANFHTGGTTGMPKIAQHRFSGMIYNGKIPAMDIIREDDVLICPLPMFHVLGAYPVLMSVLASGAHLVLPTPAGFRGDGVMDNFWALIERWGVTFMVMVPTAATALLERPVRHDLSTLRYALCGSAPLPVELFRRFEETCGVKILEGYGMTEATCLVSINPPGGERKIGSVGLPIPYSHIRILDCDGEGTIRRECATDEVGEICIASPGVFPGYRDENRNIGLFSDPGGYLRTGDLGKLDGDGYLWITGRLKDLIIRGGHNIDPGLIEEALMGHSEVAFVGAIGQPDPVAGELPAAYVELRPGATADVETLMAYARDHIPERAAIPKHLELIDELPKTAVGKVFKPELRKQAIARVLGEAFGEAGIAARIAVRDDKSRGLVAQIATDAEEAALSGVMGRFAVQWERQGL
ncbi:MAG: acyl-CoA synthetase [Pseudomonadota bacterium]